MKTVYLWDPCTNDLHESILAGDSHNASIWDIHGRDSHEILVTEARAKCPHEKLEALSEEERR